RRDVTDYPVDYEFAQTIQRHLHVRVLLNKLRIVTANSKAQIAQIDLAGKLADVQIAVRRARVERISAVNVSAGGNDQREVRHCHRTTSRRERRARVLDEWIAIERVGTALFGFPSRVLTLPIIYLFDDFHVETQFNRSLAPARLT